MVDVTDTSLPGIMRATLDQWLHANVGLVPELHYELIAGGRSNLTYRVTDTTGRSVALRRPPTGHVLPTAHDMAREHRIVSALAGSPVPVAPVLGFCDDPAVTGAPFYVMGFVDGAIVRTSESAAPLSLEQRGAASQSIIDVLADLHALDPASVGLDTLGRPDGYIERQLKRWRGQYESMKTVEIPTIDVVAERLHATVPPQMRSAIVHGDYRLDNVVLHDSGELRAVLDWEICTLGDPLADLGLLMVYWPDSADEVGPLAIDPPTALPGFWSRAELAQRYAQRTGADLTRLPYYTGFGYWKLACILQGVAYRYAHGAGVGGDPKAVEYLGTQVAVLADLAHRALRDDT